MSPDSANVPPRLLILGVNWLGDSVMSMPALQALKRAAPATRLTLVVKTPLVPLWALHPAVDEVVGFRGNAAGTWRTARALRSRRFPLAYVFPNSIRSALIPWLAGIPERVGAAGRFRRWLLTRAVAPRAAEEASHQALEYVDILGLRADGSALERPRLEVTEPAAAAVRAKGGPGSEGRWLGLIPGAARGPSKRWPAARFIEVGREWSREAGARVAVLGSAAERDLCGEVARGIGPAALNLGGETTIAELAAALRGCRAAVTNDNGGMHLAAAVGTPVIAIFGSTDPGRTGPLGPGHCVIAAEGAKRSRDIPAESPEAAACLRAIPSARALEALREVVAGSPDR